tara:strand:- start:163 stop:867 length:705 start_codon:yes stop_codon:yes gene_type:complete
MPLPVLETPTYELTVPSTKQKIKFRPFLVKEEKILMIAQETENQKEMLSAMKNIIEACTFGELNGGNLAIYDLEFIFLKLRAKSVGENVALSLKCEKCEHVNSVDVNIDNLKVKYPKKKQDNNIKLTDTVGIILKHPCVNDLDKLSGTDSTIDEMMAMIAMSIDSVYDSNQSHHHSDITPKELNAFIDSLNRNQLELITGYFESTPKVRETIKFECPECDTKNEKIVEGAQSFF